MKTLNLIVPLFAIMGATLGAARAGCPINRGEYASHGDWTLALYPASDLPGASQFGETGWVVIRNSKQNMQFVFYETASTNYSQNAMTLRDDPRTSFPLSSPLYFLDQRDLDGSDAVRPKGDPMYIITTELGSKFYHRATLHGWISIPEVWRLVGCRSDSDPTNPSKLSSTLEKLGRYSGHAELRLGVESSRSHLSRRDLTPQRLCTAAPIAATTARAAGISCGRA